MWQTRLTLERKEWVKACFITLTYNNENLPLNEKGQPTLRKKDLQDFLKRLRYYHQGADEWTNPITGEIEKPIRYFACGEYGPKGGRPHYHICIFNYEPDDLKFYKLNKHGDPIFKSKKLMNIWKHGFVTIEELNHETAGYCARYVQKKAGIAPTKRGKVISYEEVTKIDIRNGKPYQYIINHHEKKIKEIEDEFVTMSRAVGIGRKYWEEHKEKIKRNKGILLKVKDKVKLKPIPKYFKKLWEKENYIEYYRYKYEQAENGKKRKIEILAQINLGKNKLEEFTWEFYLDKQEKQLEQKVKALKRNEFI